MWYLSKNWQIEQWNSRDAEINPQNYIQRIFDKGAKEERTSMGKDNLLNKRGWNNWVNI